MKDTKTTKLTSNALFSGRKIQWLPILLLLTSMVSLTGNLHARLGESIEETDKRYGSPKFAHRHSKGDYREYNYKKMDIEVLFQDGEGVFEILHFPSRKVLTSAQSAQVSQENTEFVIAILSNVYNFSNEDTTAFIDSLQYRTRSMQAWKTVDNIVANYYINTHRLEQQGIMEASLKVNLLKVNGDDERDVLGEILTSAYKAKQHKESKKSAGGF